jgi:hypothetical protein
MIGVYFKIWLLHHFTHDLSELRSVQFAATATAAAHEGMDTVEAML